MSSIVVIHKTSRLKMMFIHWLKHAMGALLLLGLAANVNAKLIGQWNADSNANDVSTTANNGSYAGPYAPGITGRAFDFSSLNRTTGANAVFIPDNAAYSFGSELSVGFWFNVNGSTNPQVFLGQDAGPGNLPKWFIDYGYGTSGAFGLHINGPSFVFLPSNPVALPSGWNHFMLTKKGSTYTFYLNGNAIGTRSFSGTFADPINNLIFGWAEPHLGYNGLLDNVVLYDNALSATGVKSLFQVGTPLIGQWNADGNANDASPTANNGSYAGPYAPGITGRAFNFSSANRTTGANAVFIPDNAAYSFGSELSVGFWFNVNGSTNPQVFLGQDAGPGNLPKWFIDYGYGTSGAFGLHINGPSFVFLPSNPVALPSGWNHFMLTKNGTTYTFYLNGNAIGTRSFSGTFADPTDNLILGWAEPNLGYNGLLDNVALYDIGLSAVAVKALFESVVPDAAPTANAGSGQAIHAGSTVNLNGSASFDDNTPSASLGYAWNFVARPTGSTAALVNANTATPNFVADKAGTYAVQLIVTDGDGRQSSASQVVISSLNQPPSAHAGADQLVVVFNTVQLNGSGSTDPDNDALIYSWAITTAPAGSAAVLNGPRTATPNFQPDVAGSYTIRLDLSDAFAAGTPDTVEIVAVSAAAYAELKTVEASSVLAALVPAQVTTAGNKTALDNFLSQAVKALQKGDRATASVKLNEAITRTDGCERTGVPDSNGPGRDWITDCSAQSQMLSLLRAALAAAATP